MVKTCIANTWQVHFRSCFSGHVEQLEGVYRCWQDKKKHTYRELQQPLIGMPTLAMLY